MGANNWVDFREVKASVSMAMVLEHYGVNWLRKSKDQLRGRCPIHKGEGDSAFHVSLTKDAFNCFSCGAKGNVLDFVAAMEDCGVRDAALKLAEWFGVESKPKAQGRAKPAAKRAAKPKPEPQRPAEEGKACKIGRQVPAGVINPPLGFELKTVDREAAVEYVKSRGFSPDTAEGFGLAVAQGGRFKGRLVIPIHSSEAVLIGYAGRALGDQEPKYLFPGNDKGFYKSHLLFNLHRVLAAARRVPSVVVVEGFFDCMRLFEAGYPSVALMGRSVSDEQVELLRMYFRHVVLMLDGDKAGRAGTEDCLLKLGGRGVYVRAVLLADGQAPDEMTSAELGQALRY